MAVDRLTQCDNIVALAKELGISRRPLYTWREQFEPTESGDGPLPMNSHEATLREEVSRLKRVLAEKTLEVDFFSGALRTVKARRLRGIYRMYKKITIVGIH